jgi:catechol 2,3-dioxygenase-like lactoylglutathione lyase family enzyme
MVDEIEPAVDFYTKHLGFKTKMKNAPYFAMLTRDDVDFVLSTPYGPGGAAKPMNDRDPAANQGWRPFPK